MKKLLPIFLIILFVSFIGATVSTTINSPDNYATSTSTTMTINWTPVSTVNTTVTSYIYLSPVDNETMLYNKTVTADNNTANTTTITGLTTGAYKWYIKSNDDDGNVSTTSRWYEVRESSAADYFLWNNDTQNIMTLEKSSGDLWVEGSIDATLNTSLTQVENLTVDTLFGDGDTIRVGDAGTDSHSLTSEDDLFVSGKLEVDGDSYFDGSISLWNYFNIKDGLDIIFGSSSDASMEWNVAQAVDTLFMYLSSTSRSIIFADRSNLDQDYDHVEQANPTLFIHSVTSNSNLTQWGSLTHDQEDFVLDSGTDSIVLDDNTRVSGNITSGDATGNLILDIYGDGTNVILDGAYQFKFEDNVTINSHLDMDNNTIENLRLESSLDNCDSNSEGQIAYNYTSHIAQVCNSTNWVDLW